MAGDDSGADGDKDANVRGLLPIGPKLLSHDGEGSEEPTVVETPSMPPPVRISLAPPRLSMPPTTMPTARITISRTGVGAASLSRVPTTFTVLHALHTEEAARASAFGRGIALLCLLGLAFQPLLGVVLWLRLAASATLLALFSVSIWVWRRGLDEERYGRRVFRVFASSCVLASPMIVYFCGVFSPAPLLVTLGITFFGLGDDELFAVGGPIVATILYLVLATLVTLGVLPEVGLFPSTNALPMARYFMMILVPCVLFVTLWQARLSRRATFSAIRKSTDASRLAAQREAQLDEAHQNLERALRAGAGLEGRYTGVMMGRYRLAEVIGRGAMGEVYAASHLDTQEPAAVKMLSLAGLENPALIERFLREGELAMRIDVPNVVRVLEVGAAIDGAPFIAMELLRGHDLAYHLRQKKQIELSATAELVREVARGLAAAHDASVVHRDLKPQNLFLSETKTGRTIWKILDFGVSKLQGSAGTLTQHAVVGTPGYMSPEQAQGTAADRRSDIFSLGAVAYRSLTGRPPFSGTDTPQILFEIVYKNPIRPSELLPTLPRDVDLALAIALAKRPEDRFSSAFEFAEAFVHASRGRLPLEVRKRARAVLAKYPWSKATAEGNAKPEQSPPQ